MPGVSKKTPLPHWQRVMDKASWLTAADMARSTNLSAGNCHRIIFGDITPSNETILRIAKASGIPAQDIASDIVAYAFSTSATTSGIAS